MLLFLLELMLVFTVSPREFGLVEVEVEEALKLQASVVGRAGAS